MTLCGVDRGASLLVRATTVNQRRRPVRLHCSSCEAEFTYYLLCLFGEEIENVWIRNRKLNLC